MFKEVTFYSEGIRLSGVLDIPNDYKIGEKRFGIVVCHGFAQTRAIFAPEFARIFVSAGFVTLTFDYRGFGRSEGPRWRLIPLEQVEDVRSAMTFLQQQPEVNAERIGLFGNSFGGANVIYTAAIDDRAKCVVSWAGIGDGGRWLHCIRRQWEWDALLRRIEQDRVNRVLTGKSEYVGLHDIEVPDAELKRAHDERALAFPDWKCQLPLETAEKVINYKPDELVHKISPRPLLLLHKQKDTVVPLEESLSLFEKAREPKKLVIVPVSGVGSHYEFYKGQALEAWMRVVVGWFQEHLSQPDPYILILPDST